MRQLLQFCVILSLIVALTVFIDAHCITGKGEQMVRDLQREVSLYKDHAARLEAELNSLRLRCKPEVGR